MDFHKRLLEVSKALSRHEEKALAFLCKDLLKRDVTSLESANDLFSCLMDQDLLSPYEPQLLTELLLTIKRPPLLRKLELPAKAYSEISLISPYRKLLYNLSEDITKNELNDIKFMLKDELPRRKLDESATTLELFLELESMDLINDTDLDKLGSIFTSVSPRLNTKIKHFMAQQEHHTNDPAEEKIRPRSSTDPSNENQHSRTLRTGVKSLDNVFDLQNFGEKHETHCHELSGPVKKEGNDVMKGASYQESTTSSVTRIQTESLAVYPMTAEKRGVCTIVNNYRFSTLSERKGTEFDEKSLKAVFTWLGFEVEIHNDCDRKRILSVLDELSRRDHSQMDCLVFCVLSHGKERAVYGVDGLPVKLEELMDPFDGRKCPTLVEKPKLFFIQACQGSNKQKPVETDGPEQSDICCDAVPVRISIPCNADFLMGMATVPSYVSFRETKNGTWYIQSLCKNLVQMVPSQCDLMSILTKVNADVSRKTDLTGDKKQMPQPEFTLCKSVIFPVPKTPPPSLQTTTSETTTSSVSCT